MINMRTCCRTNKEDEGRGYCQLLKLNAKSGGRERIYDSEAVYIACPVIIRTTYKFKHCL